jgi:hypothetical protein
MSQLDVTIPDQLRNYTGHLDVLLEQAAQAIEQCQGEIARLEQVVADRGDTEYRRLRREIARLSALLDSYDPEWRERL